MKNNREIQVKIVSKNFDPIKFFEALSLAIGRDKILDLWRRAYRETKKSKKKNV